MADEDFDEDIYGDDDEGEIDTGVQLGFMSETKNVMFAEPNWERWDGGKVGGKPVWLDSVRIPSPSDLKCVCCNSPMIFLLQIYCPLDDMEEAFHRALYIFICKKKICVDTGSVKCFRTQMSRRNDTYRYDPKAITESPTPQTPKLCNLCGCRAPSMCSKCKKVSYCSREHQSSDWKDHKHVCQVISDATADSSKIATTVSAAESSTATTIATTTAALTTTATIATAPTEQIHNASIFPEFNLSISAEVLEDLEKVDALNKSVLEATIWENAGAVEVDDCSDDEDEKDDAHLTQTDYNTALGNEASDTIYTKFMERVRRGGSNQVLRYIRWDDIEGPLTFSSTDQTTGPQGSIPIGTDLRPSIPDLGPLILGSDATLPPSPPLAPSAPLIPVKTLTLGEQRASKGCCANCGAKREFEFQIMPQLLHFLRVDRRTKIACTLDNMPGIPEGEESTDLGPESGTDLGSDPQKDELLLQNKAEEDLDWGTIDVYTCTESCDVRTDSKDDSAYVLEGTYTQKPLLFVRNTPKPAASAPK